MLCRNSIARNLPKFDGNISDWPLFYKQYQTSSEAWGFNHQENILRLDGCLVGKVRNIVKHMLCLSDNADDIIDLLKKSFGRPEQLVHELIKEARNVPNVTDFESFLQFDTVVKNLE